ncbi:MAG: hypothetical protein WCK34_18475 [Bacteroidota bacterium]
MGGIKFNIEDDNEILKINSPVTSVGGPYKVVFKNIKERWAIVAMDWDDEPRLGIRWFWGGGGNPFSSAYPTWLVIPTSLINSILNGLPLKFTFRKKIEDYLSGDIDGSEIPCEDEC